MNKDMDTITSCIGYIVWAAVLIVVGTLANGWALSTIWNWFIPRLFGLPILGIMQAVGVSLVLGSFTGTNEIEKKSFTDDIDSPIAKAIANLLKVTLIPVLEVGIAWVVLQFAF